MASRKSEYSPDAWERHKARERERYKKNRDSPEWSAREQARVNRYIESRRRFLHAVKTTCGCVDCGTVTGRLDFDHRQRSPSAWLKLTGNTM